MSSIVGVYSRVRPSVDSTAPLQEDAAARGLFDASRGRRERKGKKKSGDGFGGVVGDDHCQEQGASGLRVR
jgi:hypothetical protein